MILAAATMVVVAGVAAAAPVPEVARISPVGGDEVMQIYGEGFKAGAVEVMSWAPQWEADMREPEAIKRALLASAAGLARGADLPAAPPKASRRLKVIDVTDQVVHAVSERTFGFTTTIVWVRNTGSDWSRPYRVNAPLPWWTRPQQAAPGQLVSVYGRRLASRRPGGVVLRDAKGALHWADVAPLYNNYFHNEYVLTFQVPAGLAPGAYVPLIHNGTGGDFGWVAAEPISVGPVQAAPAVLPIDVRAHGAKGDGLTDDTAAMVQAVAAAAAQKGGTVFFPPGQYRLSRCLELPAGVSLKGAGPGASMLVVPEGQPLEGRFPADLEEWGFKGEPKDWTPYVQELVPMIWVRSRSRIEDLGLERRAGAGPAVLVSAKGQVAEAVSLSHCRVRTLTGTAWVARRFSPDYAGLWAPNRTHGLRVVGNEFYTAGSAICLLSTAVEATIEKNLLLGAEPSHDDLFGSRGGFYRSLIVDNVIRNSKRGLVFQAPYPLRHNYIARNVVEYIDRGGNANETLLLEGGFTDQRPLRVAAASAAELRFDGPAWQPDQLKGQAVLVVRGRGFGQYGFVASNTASSVRLEQAWRVVPDQTTEVAIAWMFAENVFHENSDRRSGAALQLWGGCLANVIDAFISYDAEGVIWWAHNGDRYACYNYYNELLDSFIQEMGHLEFRAGLEADPSKRLTEAPLIVGNLIRNTALSDFRSRPNNQPGPYWKWYQAWMEPWSAAMFWTDVHGPGRRHGSRQPERWKAGMPLAGAFNVIDGCLFQRGAEGANLMPGWSHTVFYNITLDEIRTPYVDAGEGTVRDR